VHPVIADTLGYRATVGILVPVLRDIQDIPVLQATLVTQVRLAILDIVGIVLPQDTRDIQASQGIVVIQDRV
jgi:hypothetical protein